MFLFIVYLPTYLQSFYLILCKVVKIFFSLSFISINKILLYLNLVSQSQVYSRISTRGSLGSRQPRRYEISTLSQSEVTRSEANFVAAGRALLKLRRLKSRLPLMDTRLINYPNIMYVNHKQGSKCRYLVHLPSYRLYLISTLFINMNQCIFF